jgi:adenylate cyclase class IV
VSTDLRFKEIEHKYIVDEQFDVAAFREALAAMNPLRTHSIDVRDRYYLTDGARQRRVVIRHRYDAELHHLTVKTFAPDTEIRLEVNLDLGHHRGDQDAQVDAFVDQLGVQWSGTIHKNVEIWDFPDCEVVCYQASNDSSSVRCVEFEATRKLSVDGALAILLKYERATGFDAANRTRLSLLELLFPEALAYLE